MKTEENDEKNNDIEIVVGDDSVLEISKVGDCMNGLRPKNHENNSKKVVIPKVKKKDK